MRASSTSYKVATWYTSFHIKYAQEVPTPVEFLFPYLQVAIQERWDGNSLSLCFEDREELTKTCLLQFQAQLMEKSHKKGRHKNKIKDKDIDEGCSTCMLSWYRFLKELQQ